MKNTRMGDKTFRRTKRAVIITGSLTIGILFSLVLFYPSLKDDGSKKVAEWGEELVEEVIPTETRRVEVHYEYSPIPSDGVNSYWFVLAKERHKGVQWNNFVKFEHSYFSAKEAFDIMRSEANQPDIDFFLINFIEVSEATYLDAKNSGLW